MMTSFLILGRSQIKRLDDTEILRVGQKFNTVMLVNKGGILLCYLENSGSAATNRFMSRAEAFLISIGIIT